MYRCHPQIEELKGVIGRGAIGEVRLIHASFSYNMGPQYENIRMMNAFAGGSIMDVGSYGISIARFVAGEEPDKVAAVAQIGGRSRVDEVAGMTLRFPSGVVASITCGMQVAVEQTVTVYGSEGSVHLTSPWFGQSGQARILLTKGGEILELEYANPEQPIYALEAEHVRSNIEHREAPAMTLLDSLGNMRALDAARASIGLRFECE